jgi:hypothetical protein
LALAVRTPIFTEEDIVRRKTSLTAPAQASITAEEGHELPRSSASPSPATTTVDLTCYETLTPPPRPTPAALTTTAGQTPPPAHPPLRPTPATLIATARQTPPAHPHRQRRSCRR